MKTNFLYLMYFISIASIIFGLYGGISNTNRRWLWLPTGGLIAVFCTLFWLRPAIDESWHGIEIEKLRIELRGTKAQLEEQNADNSKQGEMLQEARLQLEAQQLAQRQYSDAIRSLTIQITDLRSALSAKGVVSSNAETIEGPPKDATPAALLEYATTQLASLHAFDIDPSPTRQLLRKAVTFLQVLAREFPDHAPLGSTWTDEAVARSVDPRAELDKLLSELIALRGTNKFLNEVYAEVNATLDSIRSNQNTMAIPAPRSPVARFLASEVERQEFVLQAVRDLGNISLSPEFVREVNQRLLEIEQLSGGDTTHTTSEPTESPRTDQQLNLLGGLDNAITRLKEASDITAVRGKVDTLRTKYKVEGVDVLLPEKEQLRIGQAKSTREYALLYVMGMLDRMAALQCGSSVAQVGNFVPPPSESPHAEATSFAGTHSFRLDALAGYKPGEAARLVLLDEAGEESLLFRKGAYLIDDSYTKVVRPLWQLIQQLKRDGRLIGLTRVLVRGYADQKDSNNRLYRTDLLPDHLKPILSNQESRAHDDVGDLEYVRNDHLPNLRAHWTGRILGQLFPNVEIEVADGELKEGTAPKLRTVNINLYWGN